MSKIEFNGIRKFKTENSKSFDLSDIFRCDLFPLSEFECLRSINSQLRLIIFIFESDAFDIFHPAAEVDCPHSQLIKGRFIDFIFESDRVYVLKDPSRKLFVNQSHF